MVTYCRVMLWNRDFHICEYKQSKGLQSLNGKEAFCLYGGSAEHISVWMNESPCSWRVMLPFSCCEALIHYVFQTLLYGIFISSSVIFSSGSFITSRKSWPGLMQARPPWPLLLSSEGCLQVWALNCSTESSHFSIVTPPFQGFVYYFSSASNQKFRGSFPCFLFRKWAVFFRRTWG